MKTRCYRCSKKLKEPGGLVFGPPHLQDTVYKFHVCVDCMEGLYQYLEEHPVVGEMVPSARPEFELILDPLSELYEDPADTEMEDWSEREAADELEDPPQANTVYKDFFEGIIEAIVRPRSDR